MTLDEKLDQFYKSAIDSATSQNIQIIDEYQKSLQKIYDEHKKDALRKAEVSYRVESDKLKREKNRQLSNEAIGIKRKISEKSADLTEILFQDVTSRVYAFMKTPEYITMLEKQINLALEFARGDEMTIYINISDESIKKSLEEKTKTHLTLSNRDFIGGIRAVIHEKNILIDHSFCTKLEEAINTFAL